MHLKSLLIPRLAIYYLPKTSNASYVHKLPIVKGTYNMENKRVPITYLMLSKCLDLKAVSNNVGVQG